jgi:hypothetical protein
LQGGGRLARFASSTGSLLVQLKCKLLPMCIFHDYICLVRTR